jgi:hypothetical protein
MKTKDDISRVCDATKSLLIKKNAAYGDSALSPLGVFGNGDAITSLGARMDDKLMRLKEMGIGTHSLDTLYDLHGYITLMIIAIERKEGVNSEALICDDDSNTTQTINNSIQHTNVQRNNIPERKADRQSALHNSWSSTGAYTDWWQTSSDIGVGASGEQRDKKGSTNSSLVG